MSDENQKGKRGNSRRSIDQKIEQEKAKLQRLQAQKRKQETSEKVITGAIVIESALQDQQTRDWLLNQLRTQTSDRDKHRISGLIQRLEESQPPGPAGGQRGTGTGPSEPPHIG